MMSKGKLLWVDDEIELLNAYVIYLEKKGYEVTTVSNGPDAIERCREQSFDLVFLDEMMPGLSGLDTLQQIKEIQPATPVVMVTKSEEENIMDQAIGSKIADYLIKPVNPSQILLTLKKNIHRDEIVTEVTQSEYQHNYQQLSMQIADARTFDEWTDIYRQLVHWELELATTGSNMSEILNMQKEEANNAFARYIRDNYMEWMEVKQRELQGKRRKDDWRPLMSPDLFSRCIFPLLDQGQKVFLIVIDNFRFDQWRVISRLMADHFDIDERIYLSILPTATQYARNAIFSGLMPATIAKMFPDLWVDEDDDEGKNLNEAPLIQTQIERYRRHDTFTYNKINDSEGAEHLMQQFNNMQQRQLNVVVFNFIDMLSHARTESKMVRELANNESAYRSITQSWFTHSVISELFKALAQSNCRVVLTTDHGSIRARRPIKIVGDRNTNTNLRYKLGKNLSYNSKEVFTIKDPARAMLPQPNLSTSYAFATGDTFFAYPNNYNYYVSYFRDTFQHGGISMEEMLVPLVTLTPRNAQK